MKKLGIFCSVFLMVVILLASPASAFLINVYDGGGSIVNLAGAQSAVSSGTLVGAADYSIIEFDDLGDGTRGNYSINNPFPSTYTSDFAVTVTGNIYIGDGDWTFGLNHDDGAILNIAGDTVVADGVLDNRDTFLNLSGMTAGYYSVDILFFEHLGGASLEFFGAPGTFTSWNSCDFELVQSASVPEPSTIVLMGLGLVGLAGVGRKKFIKK